MRTAIESRVFSPVRQRRRGRSASLLRSVIYRHSVRVQESHIGPARGNHSKTSLWRYEPLGRRCRRLSSGFWCLG